MAEACEQVASWERGPGLAPGFFVTVNLSPLQLQQPEFIAEIESILESTGLAPARLVLELTETAMFQDTETTLAEARTASHARGPDRPRRLRDRLFVARLPAPFPGRHPEDRPRVRRAGIGEPGEWAFAHAIVALGTTLGLKIVAEGIEEAAQADRLRQLGCDFGQGFHFARPVEARGSKRRSVGRRRVARPPLSVDTARPAEVGA